MQLRAQHFLLFALLAAFACTELQHKPDKYQDIGQNSDIQIAEATATPTKSGLELAYAAFEQGDYTAARREWRLLAAEGNVDAQYNLAIVHRDGLGVSQDYGEAERWMRKAAEQGYGKAQLVLALMYLQGIGITHDKTEALHWFTLAAKNLPSGEDKEQAITHRELIKKINLNIDAAKNGSVSSQLFIGVLYAQKDTVFYNPTESVKWFHLAAEQGKPEAQFHLGYNYYHGDGVPQDYAEAANWLSKAADQGKPEAQFQLAFVNAAGEGVPQNFVKAHMWYNLAAARSAPGDLRDGASRSRDMIADLMTPDQIAEAQRLAREWKPKAE